MNAAVIFDLDDTLYPERRFALSAFAAVAADVEARFGMPRGRAFRTLLAALRNGRRDVALQTLCESLDLPEAHVANFVQVIRTHAPRLRLPPASRCVLTMLRPRWRLGLVTNGVPAVQARKVEALGLRALIDDVVFAAEHGSGCGKPDPEPFLEIAARLRVAPGRAVFVGDNPGCDIAGARGVGMRTILVRRPRAATTLAAEVKAEIVVPSLSEVPAAVGLLHV